MCVCVCAGDIRKLLFIFLVLKYHSVQCSEYPVRLHKPSSYWPTPLLSFKKRVYLLIFVYAGSLLLRGVFSSSCGAGASHFSGFSCCKARALSAGSVVEAHWLNWPQACCLSSFLASSAVRLPGHTWAPSLRELGGLGPPTWPFKHPVSSSVEWKWCQYPLHNHMTIHRWMKGWIKCSLQTMQYYTIMHMRKSWHLRCQMLPGHPPKADEPQKHDAKWKKPDTKRHVLYDSIYVKSLD